MRKPPNMYVRFPPEGKEPSYQMCCAFAPPHRPLAWL